MAKHRRVNSSGQDSAIHLHLKEKNHSFEDSNVNTLARKDRWFDGGVKESIYWKLEVQIPRQLNNHSHLGSPSPSNLHDHLALALIQM